MIDDQPCILTYNMQVNTPSMGSIEAKYIVGTIDLSEENYSKFINDESLDFQISFETILPKFSTAKKYLVSIPKIFLNQEYIIINIFNKDSKLYKKRFGGVNKKNRKEYYIVMSTRNAMKFD
ncbi:hypothetical protein [Chryseobacterium sp.]|jgi:hypothetical protein|uniref:hypothetical protein n=1 Tax=Chryseobacterium sp. TaxID=1871047 RepID=UPI0026322BED|nr:hypothetical protein [Chryseobacterium sp.]